MKREIELERRLRALKTLGEAVGAMKSLSAHHFRETRKAVEPARIYREGVERILASTAVDLPAGVGAAGLLVIGGELGLCGGYNAKVVAAGADLRAEFGPGPTFCVGRRATTMLARRGVDVRRSYAGATSASGITRLLVDLAEDVMGTYAADGLSGFDIVSSRFGGVGVAAPVRTPLLPLQASRSETAPPVRHVARDRFAFAVARELLYITLYDLLLDALAAEHGARLVATEAAQKWLDERVETMRRQLLSARRESSTQEMIEIAAGMQAGLRR